MGYLELMSLHCLTCGEETNNNNPRFMVIPGHIIVPNEYYLCDLHKDIFYSFEDVYNPDGTRKTVYQLELEKFICEEARKSTSIRNLQKHAKRRRKNPSAKTQR